MSGGFYISDEPDNATKEDKNLLHNYQELRHYTEEIEILIGSLYKNTANFDEKDIKRLDKAIVVIKVGFKLIKMTLRKHGFKQRIKTKEFVK
jgi:hypothetical protein